MRGSTGTWAARVGGCRSRARRCTPGRNGACVLKQAITPPPPAPVVTPSLERAILTTLVEGHAGYRGIQACLRAHRGPAVRLGATPAVGEEAQRRAVRQIATPVAAP